MSDALARLHNRLDRAVKHVHDFEVETKKFLRRNHGRVVRKRYEKSGYYLYRCTSRPIPPLLLSLIAGDAIHNLRSTLDHVVHELVLKGQPLGEDRHTSFPVCATKETWANERTQRRIEGVPEEARKFIESCQPYHGGHARTDKKPSTFRDHPLWWLDRLWNWDKHRRIHLTVWSLPGQGFRILSGDHSAVAWVPVISNLDKSPIVGKVLIRKPDAKVRFKVNFLPDIQFEKRSPAPKDTSALWLLQDAHFQVSHIVKELSRFL